ncbi:MAG: sugar phosphate isomerase/epimerase [Abitibacteriaceae bacterium]|nr:sugar phosphate isomerase/epimerase [Abditibacteriaceae bacterium]
MSNTRTGNFTIGFRRGGTEWQKDIQSLIQWAKENEFGAIDIGRDGPTTGKAIQEGGLKVGSVDLMEWQGMISPDAGKRKEAVAKNAEYVKACAALGPVNHFVVMLPEKPELKRSENFGYMVESFNELAPTLEQSQARIAVEGWPGPGALVCTPEGYRAFFKECPSQSMAINYDPSHLIRMGIDPLRYLGEFADRVTHVHGKDTELLSEGLYEYGNEQPATFGKAVGFGGMHWRYTIPGHGVMRWVEAFRILKEAGYNGCVCIELEDANFNGPAESEKAGIIYGGRYLQGC